MDLYLTTLTEGITRTQEFERKGLAAFAVNVGTKCGHNCLYCSTNVLLRMHRSFKGAGRSPFAHDYAIVDLNTPRRVAEDARRIRQRGMVQLCTLTDAWAPEAHQHRLGRRCLEAILAEPGWTVRVLTKNAAVMDDFELIERHRERVLIGLSITGTAQSSAMLSVIEPHASPIADRLAAMREAAARGLRVYGMLCPLIPGIAGDAAQIDELVQFVAACGAEEIFAEPINARGPALRQVQEAMEAAGFQDAAKAVQAIRRRARWSDYVLGLLRNVQSSVRRHATIEKLRFLLYPSSLLPTHADDIRHDDAGVIWLGRTDKPGSWAGAH